MTRVYGYMFLGLIVSALTAAMFAYVPDCREFLYSVGKTGETTLSVSGWILLLLPLVMFLAVPAERKNLSFAAVLLMFCLFCGLIGAALSGVSLVFVKADVARGLLTSSVMFFAMALTGAVFRRDMISWHCILLTVVWGTLLTVLGCWLFPSGLTDWAVSMAAVIVYGAVTAYSGEEIERIIADSDRTRLNQLAVRGALAVYLNFIGLAVKVLRFWESRGKCK